MEKSFKIKDFKTASFVLFRLTSEILLQTNLFVLKPLNEFIRF